MTHPADERAVYATSDWDSSGHRHDGGAVLRGDLGIRPVPGPVVPAAAGASLLSDHHALFALGALAGTGLLAGILIAAPRISPLAAGLPGLLLVGLSVLYLVSVRRADELIPLRSHVFGTGFETLLARGLLGAAGLAMIVPLFVPSRWRSGGALSWSTSSGRTGPTLANWSAWLRGSAACPCRGRQPGRLTPRRGPGWVSSLPRLPCPPGRRRLPPRTRPRCRGAAGRPALSTEVRAPGDPGQSAPGVSG